MNVRIFCLQIMSLAVLSDVCALRQIRESLRAHVEKTTLSLPIRLSSYNTII